MRRVALLLTLVVLLALVGSVVSFLAPSELPPAAALGSPTQLTFSDADERDPAWSPDGAAIAFISTEGNSGAPPVWDIWRIGPDGQAKEQLADGPDSRLGIGWSLAWVGTTGDLLTNERVFGHEYMRFRLSQATSLPVLRVISEGTDSFFERILAIPGGLGGDSIAVSSDGATIAWAIRLTSNDVSPQTWEVRLAPLGSLTGQDARTAGYPIFHTDQGFVRGISFSPDGQKVAFAAGAAATTEDLYIFDRTQVTLTKITSSGETGTHNHDPEWGAGGRIAYASNASGDFELYLINPDGTGRIRLTNDPGQDVDPEWSPTGDSLVFASDRGDTDLNLYSMEEPFSIDTDQDGCLDGRELGPDAALGGLRDPKSFWDLMSVFTGNPLVRDATVSVADINAVVGRFGANDTGSGTFDRASDPLSTPNKVTGDEREDYHPSYDRGGSDPAGNVWNLLPPDGAISVGDIMAAVAQFGHSCA